MSDAVRLKLRYHAEWIKRLFRTSSFCFSLCCYFSFSQNLFGGENPPPVASKSQNELSLRPVWQSGLQSPFWLEWEPFDWSASPIQAKVSVPPITPALNSVEASIPATPTTLEIPPAPDMPSTSQSGISAAPVPVPTPIPTIPPTLPAPFQPPAAEVGKIESSKTNLSNISETTFVPQEEKQNITSDTVKSIAVENNVPDEKPSTPPGFIPPSFTMPIDTPAVPASPTMATIENKATAAESSIPNKPDFIPIPLPEKATPASENYSSESMVPPKLESSLPMPPANIAPIELSKSSEMESNETKSIVPESKQSEPLPFSHANNQAPVFVAPTAPQLPNIPTKPESNSTATASTESQMSTESLPVMDKTAAPTEVELAPTPSPAQLTAMPTSTEPIPEEISPDIETTLSIGPANNLPNKPSSQTLPQLVSPAEQAISEKSSVAPLPPPPSVVQSESVSQPLLVVPPPIPATDLPTEKPAEVLPAKVASIVASEGTKLMVTDSLTTPMMPAESVVAKPDVTEPLATELLTAPSGSTTEPPSVAKPNSTEPLPATPVAAEPVTTIQSTVPPAIAQPVATEPKVAVPTAIVSGVTSSTPLVVPGTFAVSEPSSPPNLQFWGAEPNAPPTVNPADQQHAEEKIPDELSTKARPAFSNSPRLRPLAVTTGPTDFVSTTEPAITAPIQVSARSLPVYTPAPSGANDTLDNGTAALGEPSPTEVPSVSVPTTDRSDADRPGVFARSKPIPDRFWDQGAVSASNTSTTEPFQNPGVMLNQPRLVESDTTVEPTPPLELVPELVPVSRLAPRPTDERLVPIPRRADSTGTSAYKVPYTPVDDKIANNVTVTAAVTPARNSTATHQVAGNAAIEVMAYNVQIYRVLPGDSYRSIAELMYQKPDWAAALCAYNQDNVPFDAALTQRRTVRIPAPKWMQVHAASLSATLILPENNRPATTPATPMTPPTTTPAIPLNTSLTTTKAAIQPPQTQPANNLVNAATPASAQPLLDPLQSWRLTAATGTHTATEHVQVARGVENDPLAGQENPIAPATATEAALDSSTQSAFSKTAVRTPLPASPATPVLPTPALPAPISPNADSTEVAKGPIYTVQPNDTLYAVAARLLGSGKRRDEIRQLNPHLQLPDVPAVGLQIRLPPDAKTPTQ